MERRRFIQQAGFLGLTAIVPQPLWAMVESQSDIQQAFHKALLNNPYLIGHANVDRERERNILPLEGKIPADFNGTLYRNGPAITERVGVRYAHLFEGDGMIRAFRFQEGRISYKDRFIRTAKYLKEQQAGRFLYDGPTTIIKNSLPVSNPDIVNTANTNVIAVGDELWALWEAGSPTRLNKDSLSTYGTVTLGDGLKTMPFSAHPKQDPNGDIWNFGLDYTSGKVIFYHLSATGKLKKTGLIESGFHAMLHDFIITEKHILLILPSLGLSKEGKGFLNRISYNPDQAVRLLVVDKNDLSLVRSHELPSGFMFHFGNGWEDQQGTIHFDCCRYDNFDIMTELGDLMRGKIDHANQVISQTVIYHISREGKISTDTINDNSEFPRIYPHVAGRQNKSLFNTTSQNNSHWKDTVRRLDLETGKIDQYHYGTGYLVEEHVVVEGKNHNRQSGGFLVGTALHWPSKKSCISLFRADHLSDGPVARGWLDFPTSLGFHGNFVP